MSKYTPSNTTNTYILFKCKRQHVSALSSHHQANFIYISLVHKVYVHAIGSQSVYLSTALLLGHYKNVNVSTYNKLVLYKQILKHVWTYGIQLWGCTKPSNIAIIQGFQNKILRNIVDAPWYERNADLRRDLHMEW
jgi:hypothetical protein